MSSRARISLIVAIIVAIVLTLVFTFPVFAGGWAVITLDELPSAVVAGEPLTVGFTVRQHGRTLMSGLSPMITAILGEQKLIFSAEAEGSPGHYTAAMIFPKEGDWQWSIQAFTMHQPMPVLTVVAAGTADMSQSLKNTGSASLLNSILPISIAVLAFGLVAAVIGFRRKNRLMLGVMVLCFLAGLPLLVVGKDRVSGMEAQAKSEFAGDSSLSQVELGRQLFLAKGCITCHSNSNATRSSEYMTIGMGAPDLSNFSASPEVLHLRLKDPTLVKSDTQMPNLHLKDSEIEALIAFINSK